MAPWIVVALATVTIVAIGVLDFATGVDLRLYPLYFVPLAAGTYRGGRRAGMALTTLCIAAWFTANVPIAGGEWSGPVATINVATQTLAFGTITLLIGTLRHRLDVERSLSRVDGLTGLHNKRAFEERAALLLEVAQRSRRPLTLAYVDLDNFKWVNDNRGHHEGDEALRTAADLLRSSSRRADVVARLGGDEFALVLSDCDAAAAEHALSRLRESATEAMRARGWPVSLSVGAVCFAEAPADLAAALAAADRLMYRAKQGGKDRLCIEEVPAPVADPA